MKNYVEVKREDGETIKIEIILSFEVEELHKKYIVYTINDDGTSPVETILISEVNPKTNRLKEIPKDEMNTVLEVYEQVKNKIVNDEV